MKWFLNDEGVVGRAISTLRVHGGPDLGVTVDDFLTKLRTAQGIERMCFARWMPWAGDPGRGWATHVWCLCTDPGSVYFQCTISYPFPLPPIHDQVSNPIIPFRRVICEIRKRRDGELVDPLKSRVVQSVNVKRPFKRICIWGVEFWIRGCCLHILPLPPPVPSLSLSLSLHIPVSSHHTYHIGSYTYWAYGVKCFRDLLQTMKPE